MNFEDLKSPEFQEKLQSCKAPEELFELAKEEGLELTDDQIASLSGGDNLLWQVLDALPQPVGR